MSRLEVFPNAAFDDFWNEERAAALSRLVEEQGVDEKALRAIIQTYLYTGKEPLRQPLVDAMVSRPSLLERIPRAEALLSEIKEYIEVYIEGIG